MKESQTTLTLAADTGLVTLYPQIHDRPSILVMIVPAYW